MTKWEQLYKEKLQTADEAVGVIPDGAHIIQTIGFAEPPAILKAINQGAKDGRWTQTSCRPQPLRRHRPTTWSL